MEYDKILDSYGNLKNGILEKMPPMVVEKGEDKGAQEETQPEQVVQVPTKVCDRVDWWCDAHVC